jgi:hypothetical protein
MFIMRKGHILIEHISPEFFGLVATLLETACIADLCVRHARPFPGEEVSQRYLTIYPFASHMIIKTRLIMTFRTGHLPMAGGSPGFHIGIHLVTEATKGRAFGEFKKCQRNNNECDDADDKRCLYCLSVVLSSFLKTRENVRPKGTDHIINFF